MRTLSRPMFRMGGPIKEGVMHGIREPRQRYADQGLVKQITEQILKKPYSSVATGVGTAATAKIAKDAAKKANLYQRAGSLFSKGIPTDVQIGRGIKKGWRGLVKRLPVKGLGYTNPFSFGLPAALSAKAAFTNITPIEKEYGITKGDWRPWKGKLVASSLPGAGGEYLPLAIQNLIGERKIEVPEDRLKNITIEKGVPGGGDPRMTYTDPDKASDLAKAAKDKRVNELLGIMGYDKAKKGAAYDALIDASQIISAAPGGKDLDISRDIIQPAIGAASKRFDKPKEIREAVGLLMAKGEIEKEIASGKPGNQLKAAQDYAAMKKISLDKAYKELGFTKKGNIGETVTAVAKQYGVSGANSDVLDSSLRILEETPPIMKIKGDNKSLKEFKEANQGKSNIELEFVDKQIQEKEPGYYIIDKRIVEVDESGDISYYY